MPLIRWGILSTAKIGVEKVIPAMQKGNLVSVNAIASRDTARAKTIAEQLGIERHYGSYEALLADPEIDAIYNPLPNHLHVPWTIKAMAAGKHALCEKPIALDAAEAKTLLDACKQYPACKVMEAFMYRFHPQWVKAKALVDSGAIGAAKTIQTIFCYFNDDPENVRNQADIGGGGLMDIGCYPISQARFLFGEEPQRVSALWDIDPNFNTDRIASAMLDFGTRSATFTCATQLNALQRSQILGTDGAIEIEIPVNPPPDQPTRLWLRQGEKTTQETFEISDQYTLQADAFSQAIVNDSPVPTPIDDALANMRVIDAIKSSAKQGQWVPV